MKAKPSSERLMRAASRQGRLLAKAPYPIGGLGEGGRIVARSYSLVRFAVSVYIAAVAAPALAAPPPHGRVQIVNANSNLCLSPAGGTGNQNEQTVQYHCDTHPSRAWQIEPVDGNIVKIRNVNSNLCLTVAGGNSDRNTPSVQYSCDDHPSRRWLYAPYDNGLFRLVNVNSGLCLTIAGGSNGLNQTAVQYPCDEHRSRFFRLK